MLTERDKLHRLQLLLKVKAKHIGALTEVPWTESHLEPTTDTLDHILEKLHREIAPELSSAWRRLGALTSRLLLTRDDFLETRVDMVVVSGDTYAELLGIVRGLLSKITEREALELSISHWHRNVAAATPDEASISGSDCALCDLHRGGNCIGCPVARHTGARVCNDTPYRAAVLAKQQWSRAVREGEPSDRLLGARSMFRQKARRMADFLESLREDAS